MNAFDNIDKVRSYKELQCQNSSWNDHLENCSHFHQLNVQRLDVLACNEVLIVDYSMLRLEL